MLHYKIINKSQIPETWGIKEDVGIRKIVDYELFFNNTTIDEFSYIDENIPEKELKKNFIQYTLLQNPEELEKIINHLNTKLDDEEFQMYLCEEDYLLETPHDIRNKNIIYDSQTCLEGNQLNHLYHSFIMKHWDLVNNYYKERM